MLSLTVANFRPYSLLVCKLFFSRLLSSQAERQKLAVIVVEFPVKIVTNDVSFESK